MALREKIVRRLYWPVCRTYARRIMGDRPAGPLGRGLYRPAFWAIHGFWPNFAAPRRFSERLWRRMLTDRDPRLTRIVDKLAVRDFVAERVGPRYLIPLVWRGTDPEAIPFADLPSKFVMKTNHGWYANIIVDDKARLETEKAKRQLAAWLKVNYCLDKYLGLEWAYKNVPPEILIETFIGDSGDLPVDYKFWCFSGRVDFLVMHFDRSRGQKTRTYMRDFVPSSYALPGDGYEGQIRRPQNFDEMIRVAEALARDFEFMRVDLYSVGGRVYFGEMTPYPNGVETNFVPENDDLVLGELWRTGARGEEPEGSTGPAGNDKMDGIPDGGFGHE